MRALVRGRNALDDLPRRRRVLGAAYDYDALYRLGSDRPFAIDDFALDPAALSEADRARGHAILEELSVGPDLPEHERVQRLALALHARLEPRLGTPEPFMRDLNGLAQYEAALAGRSAVYCANHAEIFAFFANIAHIPTRIVDVAGQPAESNPLGHTFNETLVDGRWMYVDLRLGYAGIYASEPRPLDGAALLRALESRDDPPARVAVMEGGRIAHAPFDADGYLASRFLPAGSALVYHRANQHYFSTIAHSDRLLFRPPPAYSTPSRHQPFGSGTKWRLASLWLALFGLLAWAALRVRHHRGACSCDRE